MQRLARARAAPCGGRAAPRALPPPPPLVACQSRRLAGRRLPDKRGRGGSPGRPGVITCARGAGNEQEASAPPAAPPAASSSSSPAHVSVDEAGWAEPNGGKPLEGSDAEASLIELEMEEEMVYKYGWLIFWLIATAAFGTGIYFTQGAGKAEEFFAGYLLEESLSVDNLFVFVLVFNYFKTPPSGQTKVLSYGIATAAVLRAVVIVTGVGLVEQYEGVLLVFAGILIVSSYKLLTQQDDADEADLSENDVVKLCERYINTTGTYDGDNFFSRMADGTQRATPLLLALVIVELSDVLFAVDSIPAVFGVTLDPFIVYTSNIFAILSLRALYAFVSTIMTELRYLDKAVATVLGFIGVKMCLAFVGVRVPTDVSLSVVALTLASGVGLSLALPSGKKSGGA